MKDEDLKNRRRLCETMIIIAALVVALLPSNEDHTKIFSAGFALFILSAVLYYLAIIFKWDEKMQSWFKIVALFMSATSSSVIALYLGITAPSFHVIITIVYYILLLILFSLVFLPPETSMKIFETFKKGKRRIFVWLILIFFVVFLLAYFLDLGNVFIDILRFDIVPATMNTPENQNTYIGILFNSIFAIINVIIAYLLYSETKKMRLLRTEPQVSVTLIPREEWVNWIDLRIQNIGMGPAFNIKFDIDTEFKTPIGQKLSDSPIMKELDYLEPNQKIQFFIANVVEFKKEKIPKFKIKVSYENKVGKQYNDVFLIDFNKLYGLTQLGEPPIHRIAKSIEGIDKKLSSLVNKFK